jgi:hypothetical protein
MVHCVIQLEFVKLDLDKHGLDDPKMPKVSLAKASSSPKTLGFHDVSRNPLPHNSLAECPAPSGCSRAEFPPQLARASALRRPSS